jgi:hypothetical protein
MEYRNITWDQFENWFKPVEHEFGGYLFETYGTDLEEVKARNPENVFTTIDGGGIYLDAVSGYKLVNRLNYIITTNPVEPGVSYYVTDQKAAN